MSLALAVETEPISSKLKGQYKMVRESRGATTKAAAKAKAVRTSFVYHYLFNHMNITLYETFKKYNMK